VKSVPLGDLCDVVAGGTPSRSQAEYFGGDVAWVKISDMLQGRITSTDESLTREGLASCRAKVLPVGTLLVSIFATIGRTAVLGIPAATNQAIVGVTPRRYQDLHADYLRHYLDFTAVRLNQQARGVAQNNINASMLKAVSIPLPPLAEQKRIAAVLDKADDLRGKRRQALATLDTLLRSVFLDMFGDPVTNPKGWPIVTVESLLAKGDSRIRTGPFGSQLLHSEFVAEGVPVLGIENVVTNRFRWTEPRCIAEGKYRNNFTRYRVFPGDVLVTIMGTVGRVCVAPDDLPECMSTKHLCVITLDKAKVLPVFIWASFLHDASVRSQMRMAGKGAIMEGWNSTTIRQLRVKMPPLKLQREFAEACDAILATNRSLVKHAEAADTLFATLQSGAFAGTLFHGERATAAASVPARPTARASTAAAV
jgi:type I restriction enzyme S subunit